MRPIQFVCEATVSQSPLDIAEQMLDLRRWPEFTGYGPLPGIRSAVFEERTPDVRGTRIRVTSADGSQHIETISEWNLPSRIQLEFSDFHPPLARLATRFVEIWEFTEGPDGTRVRRRFELYPRSAWTRFPLWLISRLLRGATQRHLQLIQAAGRPT